jgi:NADH-quinone oxidoreductase subunit H
MILAILVKLVLILGFALNFGGMLTWVERKQSALIHDRIGANRATIFGMRMLGMFHMIADSVKMFVKEDYRPAAADRLLFNLGPAISMLFALVSFAVIPFGSSVEVGGQTINLQVAPLNVGILYLFAVMSLAVYGVVLGAWSSTNNFGLMGGLRASAQMIAYEVTFGATIIGTLMIYQSVDLQEIVRQQGQYWTLWGLQIPKWGFIVQPLGFLLFLTAGVAETKRIPFDAPEGESEIIGYFLEYSGIKFGMYFLTDFLETVLISSILVTLFFGGWQIPWVSVEAMPNWTGAIVSMVVFTLKVVFFLWLLMTIRWTLPRFRYDQIMHLGWKILLPLSLANILVTGIVILLVE